VNLIKKYLDPRILSDDIQRFNLSIDTVLLTLKDFCIEFISSCEGKEKSKKGHRVYLEKA
jgi:hypothetical protein